MLVKQRERGVLCLFPVFYPGSYSVESFFNQFCRFEYVCNVDGCVVVLSANLLAYDECVDYVFSSCFLACLLLGIPWIE